MMRTRSSDSLPATGAQSKRQPGEIAKRREISTGMVIIFFVVTVVFMVNK
jgi:hypothetical protein